MAKRSGVADKPHRRAIEREEEYEAAKHEEPYVVRVQAGKLVPAVETDEQVLAKIGPAVIGFLKGAAAFLTKARQLEGSASSTLERAKLLKAPANAADDVRVQTFIRTTTAERKAFLEHWEITSLVHQFHRRLTGRRQIGDAFLERAQGIAQKLHNDYVAAEERRAREEQLRLEREENERAERERQAELDRMEAAALKREEALEGLSEREQRFVDAFMGDSLTRGDAAKSAVRAGFTGNGLAAGARLMGLAKIQKAIQAKREAEEIRRQAEAKAKAPLDYRPVEEVRPDVAKAAGAIDRDTHSAELIDERLLIEAVLGGRHGIPADILQVNPAKLNEYARSMREVINRWPGVRYKKTTRTI